MATRSREIPGDERWSRGCGSGAVGYSGHVNTLDYGGGIKIGNWVENDAAIESSAVNVLGSNGQFMGATIHSTHYGSEGKEGIELAASYYRTDQDLKGVCIGQHQLLAHGDTSNPVSCMATVNQLAHGEKQPEEPYVQQYLWSGSKLPQNYPNLHGTKAMGDLQVPLCTSTLSQTTRKQQQWQQQHEGEDMYATTSKSAALLAATSAAVSPAKQRPCAPAAPDGQPAQIGRKPVGPFVTETDKNYRRIGLRS